MSIVLDIPQSVGVGSPNPLDEEPRPYDIWRRKMLVVAIIPNRLKAHQVEDSRYRVGFNLSNVSKT